MRLLKSLLLVCVVGSLSYATYINTAADTFITTNVDTVSLEYQVASVTKNSDKKFLSGDAGVEVAGHFGLTWTVPDDAKTVVAGEPMDIPITVWSSGNREDHVNTDILAGANFDNTWEATFDKGWDSIAPEGQAVFVLSVTASAIAEDGDQGLLTVNFTGTEKGVYGQYDGANGSPYGGLKTLSSLITFTVNAPNIAITKSATVLAPYSWSVLPGANENDPVPGAVITYVLRVQNMGNSIANDVVITDLIPEGTELLNVDLSLLGGGSTFTCLDGNGQEVSYTQDIVMPTVKSLKVTRPELLPQQPKEFSFTVVIK